MQTRNESELLQAFYVCNHAGHVPKKSNMPRIYLPQFLIDVFEWKLGY